MINEKLYLEMLQELKDNGFWEDLMPVELKPYQKYLLKMLTKRSKLMERFNRQKAIKYMNEARKEDERLQKVLDKIYLAIETEARKEAGGMSYGPLNFALATRVASFLEEKDFITIMRPMPGGYQLEIIWEEGH